MISAEEAQRIGLVNHVYEAAELMPAAEAMAKKIIANAPLAVKYTMEAIERGMEMGQEEGMFLEATLFWLGLHDGRHARRNESVPGKAAGPIQREVTSSISHRQMAKNLRI